MMPEKKWFITQFFASQRSNPDREAKLLFITGLLRACSRNDEYAIFELI